VTAAQLFDALTRSGKPVTPARLAKARARADSPEVWAEVQARLAAHVSDTKEPRANDQP
jgi:hypothetical protein